MPAHHEVDLRQAELIAGQKALAERAAQCLAEDVRLKEGLEQLEVQRRQLAEAAKSGSEPGIIEGAAAAVRRGAAGVRATGATGCGA